MVIPNIVMKINHCGPVICSRLPRGKVYHENPYQKPCGVFDLNSFVSITVEGGNSGLMKAPVEIDIYTNCIGSLINILDIGFIT